MGENGADVEEIAEENNLQIESALPHSGNGIVEVVTEDVTDCELPADAEDEIVLDVANGNAGGAEGGDFMCLEMAIGLFPGKKATET